MQNSRSLKEAFDRPVGLKVGFHLNLSEILRSLKKGQKKENYFGNTTTPLTPTREHPRLSGDYLNVHLLIFNFKF